jgi:hypothetical protein
MPNSPKIHHFALKLHLAIKIYYNFPFKALKKVPKLGFLVCKSGNPAAHAHTLRHVHYVVAFVPIKEKVSTEACFQQFAFFPILMYVHTC